MSLGRLCPVHRLDRNVSGLLLFATGPTAANQLRMQIQAGSVVKEYVACVAGIFPETGDAPLLVDAPLSYDFKVCYVLAIALAVSCSAHVLWSCHHFADTH